MFIPMSRQIALLLLMKQAACANFATNSLTCHEECFEKPNLVNCINDDFKEGYCCKDSDTECLKKYKFCSLGMKSDPFKYFTCPTFDCPMSGEPMVIYHDKFNDEQVRELNW